MQAEFILESLLGTFNEWKCFLLDYSVEALQLRPSPEEWSLGQLYRHLIDEANYHHAQVLDCLACTTITTEGPTSDGAAMLMRNSFPAIRINGPLTGMHIPQPDSIEELSMAIDNLIAAFQVFRLEPGLEKKDCRALHPGLGYFSARQWLQFADMHLRHHLHQKRRIDSFLATRNLGR